VIASWAASQEAALLVTIARVTGRGKGMRHNLRRAVVAAATLATLAGTAVTAWHVEHCTGTTTGYCAPDVDGEPILWWDVASDGVDVGGGSPITWEIYASQPHNETWGRKVERQQPVPPGSNPGGRATRTIDLVEC